MYTRGLFAGGRAYTGLGAPAPHGCKSALFFRMFFRTVDLQWFDLICTCFTMFYEGRPGVICSDLRVRIKCKSVYRKTSKRTACKSRDLQPICACVSDKVKIHADPRACIFDVVYFELMRGVHFRHLWCFMVPWGCCRGDGRAAGAATGCHQTATESTR